LKALTERWFYILILPPNMWRKRGDEVLLVEN
jgi:hypothetical protein